MSQATPTYGFATGKAEPAIVSAIVNKYGAQALSWPIVLSAPNGNTLAYLYERNATNQINAQGNARPHSATGLPSYVLDYTATPRVIMPPAPALNQLLAPQYQNSYEFVLTSNSGHTSVDLDYVWQAGEGFKGFELTTFFMDFSCEAEAKRLVSMMNRRPSWNGPNGAHALHKIADAAADLGIEFWLVCVNTVSKGIGSPLKTSGNVLYFPLTNTQINRLSAGQAPQNAVFCSFQQFVSQL